MISVIYIESLICLILGCQAKASDKSMGTTTLTAANELFLSYWVSQSQIYCSEAEAKTLQHSYPMLFVIIFHVTH